MGCFAPMSKLPCMTLAIHCLSGVATLAAVAVLAAGVYAEAHHAPDQP